MNEAPRILRQTQPNAVRDARTAGILTKPLTGWSITMGIGGLFLGFIGATDSYQYPFLLRISFWLGLCAVAGLIAITIEAALVRFGLRTAKTLIWWLVLTITLSIAMIPVIFLVNSGGQYSPIGDLPVYARNSLAISAGLTALRILIGIILDRPAASLDNSPEPEAAAGETGNEASSPAILGRLTAALQTTQLRALKSDGHYLKVYTDLGDELILMRLKDAIAETTPVEGMQVHRSWWIAREAVQDRRSNDGRLELRLDDETWVPVSRSFRAAWKKQGW